jgi:hypothetical protein
LITFYDFGGAAPPPALPTTNLIAWYDPSDITTLFQDAAMTTPVTASGQNVRAILDKSGLGNHLIHSAGATMTYTDSGGLKSISFSNTYLQTTTFAGANALSQLSMIAAWNLGTRANCIPFIMGSSTAFTARGLEVQHSSTGPVTNVYVNPTTIFAFNTGNLVGAARVVNAWFDGTAAAGLKAGLRIDGAPITVASGTSASTVTPNCTALRLPSFATVSGGGAHGELYGLALYSDVKSGADLIDAEEHMAAKAGISI